MARKTDPKKTEYEKETKETIGTEQKVIVSRTKEYCTHCVRNKEWVSLHRHHAVRVAVGVTNFVRGYWGYS